MRHIDETDRQDWNDWRKAALHAMAQTGARTRSRGSAYQMPLQETARHQRRRDEITFLIMRHSNPSGLRWQTGMIVR